MQRTWAWCAASLALALPGALAAATVLERQVTVTVAADGTLEQRTSLRVRMDSAPDVAAWETYAIPLDDNRKLVSLEAYGLAPDGQRTTVRRRDQDTLEHSGAGVLYGSSHYHLVSFPGVAVGWVLAVDFYVQMQPYYPADRISLRGADAVDKLTIEVRSAAPQRLRWRLEGPRDGLEVEETERGVMVRGDHLPRLDPPDWAPAGSDLYPVLYYAWDGDGGWPEVGRWYADLVASLPRHAPPVRSLAAELAGDGAAPRQRLEALLGFLRRKVRYVAVEVGIGGYRPSPPEEVLSRRWGDCKDKALLLVDLLDEAGIRAYPALILAGDDRRIDAGFPSPAQFNHLIVAVPAAGVALRDGDPTAGGYLFVDPTQTRGTARWLHPAVQDQDALVVREDGPVLVHTPLRPEDERRTMRATLRVTAEGDAIGGAGVQLSGEASLGFLEQLATAPPERTEEDARAIFAHLLPRARLKNVAWNERAEDVPGVDLSAALTVDGLVQGAGARASFRIPSILSTPDPRHLEGRTLPVVLPARSTEQAWHLMLPAGWCPPAPQEERVANGVGRFEQVVTPTDSGVSIERRLVIERRWIAPRELPQLLELAWAERRAERRRIRLECSEEEPREAGS